MSSDILDILNEDWVSFSVEKQVPTKFIVAGNDAFVSRASASPFIGSRNTQTLISYTHRSVIKPESNIDIRYLVLKDFVLENSGISKIIPVNHSRSGPGDPFFEVYNNSDEPFYLERSVDAQVLPELGAGVAWIFGDSGVGKTSMIRRAILRSGWSLKQLMLGSYKRENACELLHAMCVELADIQGSTEVAAPGLTEAELIGFFRRQLRLTPPSHTLGLLIEEIPLSQSDAMRDFLEIVLKLRLAIDADVSLSSRVVLVFSSINNPKSCVGTGAFKLNERLRALQMTRWIPSEIGELIEKLLNESLFTLTNVEKEELVSAANGSPRFVKMFFRRSRSASSYEFGRVLTEVKADLA